MNYTIFLPLTVNNNTVYMYYMLFSIAYVNMCLVRELKYA